MGIRKLDWNDWIEMDSNFLRYHDLKASELKKDFASHVKYLDNPVVRDACFEVYEELNEYLIHRYPKVFQNNGKSLRNTLTGEQHPYPASKRHLSTPNLHDCAAFGTDYQCEGSPEEALSCAALLVQDDLVLMVEEDGSYSQGGKLTLRHGDTDNTNRWAISLGCRRCLLARILATQRKVSHVPRYTPYRSWRASLPGKITEVNEQVLQEHDA
jgi:hypothetical protein